MSGKASSSSAIQPSSANQKPGVSVWVVTKLLFASACMFALPIATYYISLETIFNGNGTYAAGAAAGMANIVAIGYVIAASLEDNTSKDKKD
ncbi:hypothetical protein BCR43DRAFT_483323 [Syncephalastrum racemosum]|uniref:Vacuolar ATPase assembly integral membrane protein VMA21 n=1 Tax=Syncephalastrum racemosum TaxID=13706 RepID=A0A1X2HV25_SYNRA|nr:hypothetical protein BCR43DRAFT_483323 [Syncephalastrum racemosum]